jgi:hypothetical protein
MLRLSSAMKVFAHHRDIPAMPSRDRLGPYRWPVTSLMISATRESVRSFGGVDGPDNGGLTSLRKGAGGSDLTQFAITPGA